MKKLISAFAVCALLSLMVGCKSSKQSVKKEAKPMVTQKNNDMKKSCLPCAKAQKTAPKSIKSKTVKPKAKAKKKAVTQKATPKKKSSY